MCLIVRNVCAAAADKRAKENGKEEEERHKNEFLGIIKHFQVIIQFVGGF